MMQHSYLPQFPNQPSTPYHHPHQMPLHNFQPQQSQPVYPTQQVNAQNMKSDQPANRFYKRQPNSDLSISRSAGLGTLPDAKKDLSKLKARFDSAPQIHSQFQSNQPNPSIQQHNMTKVVSLRHIPNDLSDLQIALIGLQFGEVVNLLYIKPKGQALIDFSSVNEAHEMFKYFRERLNESNSSIRGVEAAHSSYQLLTIENSNRASQTLNTIQLAKQIKESSVNGGDGHVIKALIGNVFYPICIDALYQVFSKYGNVLKIVLIQKNELGALIQMKDEKQARQALTNLNGRNMYNTYTGGCNNLNLQISRNKTIEVKVNNSKSWDYTNPLLPIQMDPRLPGGPFEMHHQGKNQADHLVSPMHSISMTAAGHPSNFGNSSQFVQQSQHAPQQRLHHQIPQMSNQSSYNQAAAAAAAAAAVAAQSIPGFSPGSTVVQISNFPDQIANPDAIFTLFGVYGDILKVKIMYNRRDNALMQFKTYEQALNAVTKMDKVKLFEKVISVAFSKFPEIQLPMKNDGGLAKDYSTSPLHRFKKPGSKNFFNIYPPNVTLHLSNISQATTEEQINELFSKYGKIVNFKWINKENNKMALIELSSLEESVLALIGLHNFQLNGSYLRVNFAKEYRNN